MKKMMFGAIALAIAGPAYAQAAPQEHKMACCEKMKQDGKGCCCKDMAKKDHGEHGQQHPSDGERGQTGHAGHGEHTD